MEVRVTRLRTGGGVACELDIREINIDSLWVQCTQFETMSHFCPVSFCVGVTFSEYSHSHVVSTMVRQAKVLGYWGKTITLFDITYMFSEMFS